VRDRDTHRPEKNSNKNEFHKKVEIKYKKKGNNKNWDKNLYTDTFLALFCISSGSRWLFFSFIRKKYLKRIIKECFYDLLFLFVSEKFLISHIHILTRQKKISKENETTKLNMNT